MHRHMCIEGGNIHHCAVALLEHGLSGVLHGEHYTFEAKIDGEVPISFFHACDIRVLVGARDMKACIHRTKAIDRRGK